MIVPKWGPSAPLLTVVCALAQVVLASPPLTTIQDVLYKADGNRFNGIVVISWNSFEASDTSNITTQAITARIVNGGLRVRLVPTTTAQPQASYLVKYNSDGKVQFTEIWNVPPSATTLRVRDVRVPGPPPVTEPTQISIDNVIGLSTELAARPTKSPAYAAGRTLFANASGALEAISGGASDCVRVDGTSGPCGGSATFAFVDNETPAGVIDGANASFQLASTPAPASSLALFRNGVRQKPSLDYTLSGQAVQFLTVAVPQTGDTLLASYRVAAVGASVPQFVDGEIPSGIVDGANAAFLLASAPAPASSLALYRNGLLQKPAQDYTLSGSAIQFLSAAVPQPGDTLLASYRLAPPGP